jgi:RimJ/RimL family protein N-acetyltransferase
MKVTSREMQKKWLIDNVYSNNFYFIIVEKISNNPCGYISLKIKNEYTRDGHLAIKLNNSSQGRGLGLDAIKTAMSYFFFTINLYRLHSHIIDFNFVSQHVFINKCGWRKEGVGVKSIYIKGKYHDNYYVAILKDEFIEIEKDQFYNLMLNGND